MTKYATPQEKAAKLKLSTPCCNISFIPVMESAGSYMGDEYAGLECLECMNTWDRDGELVKTSYEVVTDDGYGINLYGHPDELEKKAEEALRLIEKHGVNRARELMRPY